MKDELLKIRKETMEDILNFCERLPEMDSIEVVIEFQQKVRNLIDYIIRLEQDIRDADCGSMDQLRKEYKEK